MSEEQVPSSLKQSIVAADEDEDVQGAGDVDVTRESWRLAEDETAEAFGVDKVE